MTWKNRNRLCCALAAWGVCFLATGCGPDAKDKKIQDLTAENNNLKGELEERDRKLNDALVRENDSKGTIDELNNQLSRMRAEGGKVKGGEGWVTMGNFDMISIPGSVLFESGKAELTPAGRSKLGQLA